MVDIGTTASQKITVANLLTLFVTNVVVQTLVATGTYTPTTNMKKCLVICVGGGGGGGGGINTDSSGGGGGGGGTAIKLLTSANIGASKAFTIGAAGTGDTGAGAAAGGSTYLGAGGSELVRATGGGLGASGAGWSSAYVYAAGGAGGVGDIGDLLMKGSPGQIGTTWSGTLGEAGAGGCSFFGGSGLQPAVNTNGSVGGSYGAGGGGGHASAVTNKDGGNGKIGIIYVIEFLG